MTSAQHPNRIYFSSLDRSPVDSNTDFNISFDTPIENAKNFEVVTASFPNTFHQFAPYETILYFYHELFFGGTIAIGIPMSITLFQEGGATGENVIPTSRPAGRQEYIDGRYFLDGEDLQDYLNDWIQSLSVSWPTQASGLRPFYHSNDDPTLPVTYVASEVASGITFSTLSFDYDTTTTAGGRGSLKYTFTDSGGSDVRIASITNYGILRQDWIYPSQLGYKIGYTDLTDEAFGDVVEINSTNNQFIIGITSPINYVINSTNNQFSLQYSVGGGSATDNVFTIANGTYTLAQLVTALNGATTPPDSSIVWSAINSTLQASVTVTGATAGTSVNINAGYGGSTLYNMIGYASTVSIGTAGVDPFPMVHVGGPVVPTNNTGYEEVTYTLDTADYTADALAVEIQQCLRTQNTKGQVYTYVGSTTTVSASANILTFTFTSILSGLGGELKFVGNSILQACGVTLGFGANRFIFGTGGTLTASNIVVFQGAPTTASHVATDPINLVRTSNIYFASSLSGGESLSSAGRKDILFSVALTAPVGGVQLYQSSLSGLIVNRPPDVLRNLRVTLLDDNFQTMEAMPQNSVINVEIHFAYTDENQTNNISTIMRY